MSFHIRTTPILASVVLGLSACASGTLPQQQLMQTQSAIASTEELSAEDPDAKLHLKYAREQMDNAQRLMARGEEEEARRMLDRASADANLALALARTEKVRKESDDARAKVDALRGGGSESAPSGGADAEEGSAAAGDVSAVE